MSRIPDDAPVFAMAVAEQMTGLTRRRIRYYEKVGLLEPNRTEGNRRLYSQADIRRLGQIKRLLEEGHSLQGIAALLPEQGPTDEVGRPAATTAMGASKQRAGRFELGYPGVSSPERRLEMYEEARARLLGRGPAGSADRLFPSDSGRLTGMPAKGGRAGSGAERDAGRARAKPAPGRTTGGRKPDQTGA